MAGKETTGIPLWQKYALSVEEASKYFRIGQAKLRSSSMKMRMQTLSCGMGIDHK